MRWDPLKDLIELQRRGRAGADRSASWSPPMDLYETPDRYVLTIEACGLTREDVTLEVEQDVLRVHGTRPSPASEGIEFYRVERGYGAFMRSFTFPDPIDTAGITADFSDGVLTVTVPKAPRPEPRRIPVR